jgi:hypothetical protein
LGFVKPYCATQAPNQDEEELPIDLFRRYAPPRRTQAQMFFWPPQYPQYFSLVLYPAASRTY